MDVPLAVSQWDSLIAVNYEARKHGVNRHDNTRIALKKCPNLKLIHVATIEQGSTEPSYKKEIPDFKNNKISLFFYRKESDKIQEIITKKYSTVEKASVDEFYIDLTNEAELASTNEADPTALGEIIGEIKPHREINKKLLKSAQIAKKLREEIFRSLGYSVSAGISYTKKLAKICSGKNKPNDQTVLLYENSYDLLKEYPINKFPGFQGKTGQKIIEATKLEFIGQLLKLDLNQLQGIVPKKQAEQLFLAIRGMEDQEVNGNKHTKSISAVKAFRPIVTTKKELYTWIDVLCTELYSRITHDIIEKYEFKSVTIGYRDAKRISNKTKSVSKKNIAFYIKYKEIDKLVQDTINEIEILPCSKLSISFNINNKENNQSPESKNKLESNSLKSSPQKRKKTISILDYFGKP